MVPAMRCPTCRRAAVEGKTQPHLKWGFVTSHVIWTVLQFLLMHKEGTSTMYLTLPCLTKGTLGRDVPWHNDGRM